MSATPPSKISDARRRRAAVIVVFGMTLLGAAHLAVLVDRFAVNLLTDDLWDVYTAFEPDRSLWELFRWLHLPHRQGLGNWLIAVVNELSGWNTRAVAASIAALLTLSAAVALRLKHRLTGTIEFADIAIPAAVLTASQHGTLIRVPNPAHSALPLLLVLITACVWIGAGKGWRRLLMLTPLLFAAVHTGFAFFLLPVVLIRYLIEWRLDRDEKNREPLYGTFLCLACLGIFFVGYPAWWNWGAGTNLVTPDLLFVPTFIQIALSRFVGVSFLAWGAPALITGLLLAAALLITIARATRQLLRAPHDVADAVFILSMFSGLYILAAAAGRVHLSPMTGEHSRYMTLLIPGALAIYITATRTRWRGWRWVVVALVIAGSFPHALSSTHPAADRSAKATSWRDCYLQHEDISTCDRQAAFTIYPDEGRRIVLAERLRFLKQHRLNLFVDSR